MNGNDVGVAQAGGGFGFAQKTFPGCRVLQFFPVRALEGDVAAQNRVAGAKYHTHPAAPEFLQ